MVIVIVRSIRVESKSIFSQMKIHEWLYEEDPILKIVVVKILKNRLI